ncbi:MAG: type II CRISPR RNA-guided endonuclease Cas9, partial [Flavobacteriales bacterium]|nr:type II CRISPR RNA-guided endonuclease Cas9 [Flavobacteriales bacterium]
TYIDLVKLFTKEFDIEHIIPKAVLFDDSFSNKTLAVRDFNRFKSNKTGIDSIVEKYGENSEDYNRYVSIIEKLIKDKTISKAKYNKLLMKGTEIPDGFIERDLRNTQYISKKAKEMLQEVFRTVTPITGIVTSKLRNDWQLINVMQELNWDKYEKLGLTKYEKNKDGKKIPRIIDWTKRNDHRHHAMDALTVAFTKHNHIQYYNFLNARKDEKHKEYAKIVKIEKSIVETIEDKKGNRKRLMKPPMPIKEFRAEAKKHLENTLISFKAKNKVVTRNKNKIRGQDKPQETLTPRGQLHKETVYGKSKFYETKLEKIGAKFDEKKIKTVAKKSYREVLLKRLAEFDNEPKKAFGGKNALTKNPIYLDAAETIELPEKVKLVTIVNQFSIRKDITPELKIEKVVDKGVQIILQKRLDEFNGDVKKAFVNLEENPIWLNKEKGIQLKRVTITGVSNAEALHHKKDHLGKEILDNDGNPIPTDYVSTGNNHHVAIYKDGEGNLQEEVVSFYEAVMRKNVGVDVILKNHPDHPDWEFLFTMKQNEMFVFPNEDTGFNPNETDLLADENYKIITSNLFRVQKITTKDYWFRHHLETTVENLKETKEVTWKRLGINGIEGIIKVRINHIGKIVKIGE